MHARYWLLTLLPLPPFLSGCLNSTLSIADDLHNKWNGQSVQTFFKHYGTPESVSIGENNRKLYVWRGGIAQSSSNENTPKSIGCTLNLYTTNELITGIRLEDSIGSTGLSSCAETFRVPDTTDSETKIDHEKKPLEKTQPKEISCELPNSLASTRPNHSRSKNDITCNNLPTPVEPNQHDKQELENYKTEDLEKKTPPSPLATSCVTITKTTPEKSHGSKQSFWDIFSFGKSSDCKSNQAQSIGIKNQLPTMTCKDLNESNGLTTVTCLDL